MLLRKFETFSKNRMALAMLVLIFNVVASLNIRNIVLDGSGGNALNTGDGHTQNASVKDADSGAKISSLSKEIVDQLTTNNPCLIHYCSKGRECTIDAVTNRPICICQQYCSHRKRPICGSDGRVYGNHCELHRASCIHDQPIIYQRFDKCSVQQKTANSTRVELTTAAAAAAENRISSDSTVFEALPSASSSDAAVAAISSTVAALPIISPGLNWSSPILNEIESVVSAGAMAQGRNKYCSSQEYEIMKDNLLLYSHARLMSQDNNHSKDFLVSIMFSHYDQNNNGHLEMEELSQISIDERLEELSNGCVLDDMLNFDDIDHDGKLSINEFYQAFSKLYSVSVVSLDKALETNQLSARVGDNVEIKCDVTGSPSPQIIWRRKSVDLSSLNEDEIRVFSDGSLYLTRIQLLHSGNYTCHAQRNKDVVQTHILTVYTVPEVRVMPRIQSKRPGENSEMSCHVTADPFPKVEWLKNDVHIDLNEKPDKYQIIGNGTSLRIRNIAYSDTGAYMCQARNIGGIVRDISSLVVQEEPTPTALTEERKFFVFHEYGVAIYEPSACRLHHQIQGTDIIPGTQEYVCGDKGIACSWGRAINVGTRYIYVSQPNRDRVLVVSTIQMVVVDVIATDKFPVELNYVPRLDQVWVLNWRAAENGGDSKTIQVIRDAGQRRKHHTVHPEPIDGQFDLVKDLFIPSPELEQPHFSYKYAYVTHRNQRGLYKLDLTNLRYTKSVDLTLYNCVPERVEFSALYGFVILSCQEPITNRPQGQLVLDYLSDAVLSTKPGLNGIPRISPDSRHLVTVEHKTNGVAIVIQKVTPNGLEFLFDVKTTLNISDITFYDSQNMHGYDVFASASDKEDILYLNLFTGKVEMITGIGPAMPQSLVKWGNPTRLIRSSGLFGQFIVTPANNAIFVINGRARTVNCEIGGVLHPLAIVWIHRPVFLTAAGSSEIIKTT